MSQVLLRYSFHSIQEIEPGMKLQKENFRTVWDGSGASFSQRTAWIPPPGHCCEFLPTSEDETFTPEFFHQNLNGNAGEKSGIVWRTVHKIPLRFIIVPQSQLWPRRTWNMEHGMGGAIEEAISPFMETSQQPLSDRLSEDDPTTNVAFSTP